MYYVLYYNLTLLHQTNNDINKVYEKMGRFLLYLMFAIKFYKSVTLYCQYLFHKTNYLFKYDRKVEILRKKMITNQWIPPTLSNMFDNCLSQIVGLNR